MSNLSSKGLFPYHVLSPRRCEAALAFAFVFPRSSPGVGFFGPSSAPSFPAKKFFRPKVSARLSAGKFPVRSSLTAAPRQEEGEDISYKIETLGHLRDGAFGDYPDESVLLDVADLPLPLLIQSASALRDCRPVFPHVITFSPKVFIPLTRACRDSCGYCTFAMGPKPGERIFMTIDEVLGIAKAGVAAGCTEALFTLGDKPELLYPQAREELATLGHTTTIAYVAEVSKIVLEETGLLPHINAGVMSGADIALLRTVSVSQGLMLESVSNRLLEPTGAHFNCPDKVPAARIATIAAAGKEMVPFTSGVLIGIGETKVERLETLFQLRDLHKRFGHLQEIIIQNFRAKKGTRMANSIEPPFEELQWTVAMARLTFGPAMSIQVPPNLTPELGVSSRAELWKALIDAGINDWGGISPLTKDWVNPEAPWPHLTSLATATADAGKLLLPRLAVYPTYIEDASRWLDNGVIKWVLQNANSIGYGRGECWSPGLSQATAISTNFVSPYDSTFGIERDSSVETNGQVPIIADSHKIAVDASYTNGVSVSVSVDGTILPSFLPKTSMNTGITEILQTAITGQDLSEVDIVRLFHSLGPDFQEVCSAADFLRSEVNGPKVTYVVNRNINYTNICSYKCQFCAFSKGKYSEVLRGKQYRLSLEEISRRAVEAWERGATEVCLQGGIHPEFTGHTYLEILHTIKSAAPNIHIHAFSPLEVVHGAKTLNMSLYDYLSKLKHAGLASLPGTAAEVLDDSVRSVICPDKISSKEWLQVMEISHSIGLRSTSTIMFGHVDRPQHWARHLLLVRELQKKTHGFTEFVPLPFVHMQAPLYLRGKSRKGPTRRECVLMHAIARLVLHPYLTNIQASWVKMGTVGVQALLQVGCNDMGGSLMNESITRAAGASHGEELSPSEMEKLILSCGRIPEQRTTLYGTASLGQVERSFSANQLQPLNN